MRVPHPIPYQGSKRRLAPVILRFFPQEVATLYEPFAGSAALTLAAAAKQLASHFVIGDSLAPLADLWRRIVESPEDVANEYEALWTAQRPDPRAYYNDVREEFNKSKDPIQLLYLLARCVKNAVRFNTYGEFNQGADHRRLGMKPAKMRAAVLGASELLSGQCTVVAGDYRDILGAATEQDLVYMDPPYQGVSQNRDPRYAQQLDLDAFIETLTRLNANNVRYIISFDGRCGDKEYGPPLPEHLGLHRMTIDAGRSSQATLNGQRDRTLESLYLSRNLAAKHRSLPTDLALDADPRQLGLFGAQY